MPETWWCLVLAPFVGSFLGVLIHRLPRGQPVALSRSVCETCQRPLAPLELVPLVSFAVLRGRCRCGASHIAVRHLSVEVAALFVAAWSISTTAQPALAWANCGLGWTLLALGWIDWEWRRLPDVLTLPLVAGGLVVTAFLDVDQVGDHALGAIAGYVVFRSMAWLYKRLRGVDGLGHGDAKLLSAAGAWLGWEALNATVLLAALFGILLTLLTALVRSGSLRSLRGATVVSFGPPLSLSLWLLRIYGPDLLGWLGI